VAAKSHGRSLWLSLGAVLVIGFAVVAGSSVDPAASAPTSHSFPTFFTTGKLAFCKFHTDISGENAFIPWLNCWRPRDGFTVTMESTGRPGFGPLKENKGPVESVLLPRWLIRFGETWWGNRRAEQGNGSGRGRVLFRCTSRTSGLTCRSVSGHGFWLGRARGHRIF
jgi:hypothetical protein